MKKHFISTEDWSKTELENLLHQANELKDSPFRKDLQNKSIALLFFNPSMRTRTSFELGMQQLGGQAIVLQPGKDAWGIAFDEGKVMNDDAEEHIKEVAAVLSSYVDAIAVRAFPDFCDWQYDKKDHLVKALVQHASVPVINMETIVHPCQELALMMTMKKHLGVLDNKKFLLTWTYHPKPLNMAVANSAISIASKFGMDVTLLCPNEHFLLDQHYLDNARNHCVNNGAEFTISHDIKQSYQGADFVYAKSWGALSFYGDQKSEYKQRRKYQHFMVDQQKMALTNKARFSHCLPLRRNVKATDAVVDSDYCVAIEEAENRLHTQKALLLNLLGEQK